MGFSLGGAISGGLSGFLGSGGNPYAAAVGAIGSGLLGGEAQAGQAAANKMQMAQAQKQMDFQERMSSTAYQRAVTDLRKAGLNPILAGKVGGSSSPGGAMAQIQNEIQPGIATAFQGAQLGMEAKRMQADVQNVVQQAATGRSQEWLNSANRALTSLSYNEKLLYMNMLEAEIKIKTRDAEIADSQAGKVLRWIREAREAILGGSSVQPLNLNSPRR